MAFCSKRKGKKGMLMEVVPALIVLAITAIILLGFLAAIWKVSLDRYVKRSTCAMSVVIKDKFNLWGFGDALGYELKCNPIFVEVKKEEKINHVVIDEMYDCWKTLGRGELDIISNFDFWSTDTACIVCSIIKPSKEMKTLNMAEFEERLNNYNVEAEDRSFADYFTKSDEELEFDKKGLESIEITKENPLYIVYFFYKTSKEKTAEEYLGLFDASEIAVLGSKSGRKTLTFIAKKAAGRTALKALTFGAGLGVGIAVDVAYATSYKSKLTQGVVMLSGEEIVSGCSELR